MAGWHAREERSYGFHSDITANVQSYMHGSFAMDNLVSQIIHRNPNEQLSIGLSHLEVGESDSLNQPVDFSSLDMSSALSSVALNRIWDFKTRLLDFVPPSDVQEDSPVSRLENLNENHNRLSSPTEELQTVTFKYLDFFPLYQDFLHTVRDKAFKLRDLDVSELIKPQCFQDLKQKRDADCSESEGFVGLQSPLSPCGSVRVSALGSPHVGNSPSTLTRSASFWQDLEEVKASGLLKILTRKEISLQESIFELISSEASYLKSLGVAVSHFYASEALKKTMSKIEHNILFSNVCQVMAASARFLKELEIRMEENPFISQVGDIVLKHSQDFHQCYVQYVSDMSYQESLVNQLMAQNQHFVYTLKKLERDPKCERHPLKSFLVLPFQRITRIKLLLESILKLTETHTDSASSLTKAIDAIHKILTSCDTKVKKMKQIEELICLEMLLDFGTIKAVPLVTSARFLIHQGSMKWLTSTNSLRMSLISIHLHLFNDLLIISSKKYQRFMVVDHVLFPAHVTVQHLNTDTLRLPPDSFLLHLSQSHAGPPTAMVLVAHTRSDKDMWMKMLSSK